MARYILDIPDKVIAHIRADYGHGVKWINEEDRKILVELIYDAKPLPKGHGRLIDERLLYEIIEEMKGDEE